MSEQTEATDGAGDRALPVAAVVVDTPLAHLDRPFEYAVPEDMLESAAPGARVRVRFAGRDLDGFVVERRDEAEHGGRLSPLRRVVSSEPVLTPELLALCRAVADRYAGTISDVLRLAIPKRHATAERNLPLAPPSPPSPPSPNGPLVAERAGGPSSSATNGPFEEGNGADAGLEVGPWAAYPAGAAWLRRVAGGEGPAAAWSALPGQQPEDDWPRALALAAEAALHGGRGAVLVVPDHRDVDRLDAALTEVLGRGRHVRLTADQGPQARYTAWLKVLRGHVDVAIGTRAAAFAPVRNLGLVAWWDDGDDLLLEPRAPYPHSGTVLQIRAAQTGAAVLAAGFARSLRVQESLDRGRLVPVEADPPLLRAVAPRVTIAGEGADEERDGPAARAHLPSRAWRVAKDALRDGPVLVQVPRRGYLPSLSCAECRTPVRCARCHGPVSVGGPDVPPACRWCGAALGSGGRGAGFECRECGSRRLRSSVTGARRTAEEIGRAFPGAPVVTSGSGEVHAVVEDEPAIVIATPGAEPLAPKGYAAVLLLDAWASLDLPVLDAATESMRRWAAAAALARPGRSVVLCGVPEGVTLPPVEALVRWDPGWLAERELADRRELGLPPTVRMAQLGGPRRAVEEALRQVDLPGSAQVLGPMPLPDSGRRGSAGAESLWHALLRVPVEDTEDLTSSLQALRAVRSARKEAEAVTVRVDPVEGF